jgi:YHS domain-containing protein
VSSHEGSNERIRNMRKSSAVMQKEFDKAKLEYPFEGDLLEIQLESGKWLQTTRISFRSYDGPRRITKYNTKLTINPLDHQSVTTGSLTYDYEGPVYYYGSNREGGWRGTFKVLYSQELEMDEVNNKYY